MPVESRRALSGSNTVEHRDYSLTTIEFRDGEGAVTFEGVASVVDRPYSVRDQWGEFTETVAAGAFNKTLRDSKADVALYVNHRHDDVPLATRLAGTLSLEANPDLAVNADMDPIRSDVVIVRSALRRKEMRQMSIGFMVPKGKDSWNADMTERTIHELKLVEVSIVKDGANPYTTASVRSARDTHARFNERAAENGMSYGDIANLVCDAVCDMIEEMAGMAPDDCCICDIGADWAVYCLADADMYQIPYTIEGTVVTLGAPFEVTCKTVYTPVAEGDSVTSEADELRFDELELWIERVRLLQI